MEEPRQQLQTSLAELKMLVSKNTVHRPGKHHGPLSCDGTARVCLPNCLRSKCVTRAVTTTFPRRGMRYLTRQTLQNPFSTHSTPPKSTPSPNTRHLYYNGLHAAGVAHGNAARYAALGRGHRWPLRLRAVQPRLRVPARLQLQPDLSPARSKCYFPSS